MSSSNYTDPNNCALDAQGNLKNVKNIVFYESATEETLIQQSRKGKDRAHGPSQTSKLLSYVNSYFSKADPTFCIAVQALKKSAAVLAKADNVLNFITRQSMLLVSTLMMRVTNLTVKV